MSAFGVGSVVFVVFALIGLALLTVGIIFLIKDIKWKNEKEQQGLKSTSNIIGIVGFSLMIFLGVIWLWCFGAGAVVFGVIGSTF